ncbi:MAG: hypothetical protein V4631_15745 [Pseudomonadota bacterium]
MNVMLLTLRQLGHQVDEQSLDPEYCSAKFSKMTFRESHERLAELFLKYCEVAPLTVQEGAFAAAIAAAILVHDCRDVLSVEKGAALAVFGFVEGTKTAPFPSGSAAPSAPPARRSRPAVKKDPWYKFW